MTCQVCIKPNEWDSCLAGTGISTVFCSRDFSALYCPAPQLFVYRKGPHAAAFVFNRAQDTVSGLHYGGVITNCLDGDFCSGAAGALTEYLRGQGVSRYQIRNHPFLNTVKVGELLKEEPFVFIGLARPEEELVSAITKQHRRCIRRAQESGLDVIYTGDARYLKAFYGLYKTHQEQKGLQPKDHAFFDRMAGVLKDRLVMAVVRDADKVLAVSLLLQDAGDVFMTYGGMSEEGYGRYAKHLMISDMIAQFKSKGFSRLVLGTGNNGKDPVYDFKKGFTDKECSVRTYGVR